jgi:Fe-S cluster assembly iron-binding protein IscA
MDGLCSALIGAHLPWVKNVAESDFTIEAPQGIVMYGASIKYVEKYILSPEICQKPNKTMNIAN